MCEYNIVQVDNQTKKKQYMVDYVLKYETDNLIDKGYMVWSSGW